MAASRNNVRKRGSTWTYYAYVTDGAGKRRQISKGGFATRREAEIVRILVNLVEGPVSLAQAVCSSPPASRGCAELLVAISWRAVGPQEASALQEGNDRASASATHA